MPNSELSKPSALAHTGRRGPRRSVRHTLHDVMATVAPVPPYTSDHAFLESSERQKRIGNMIDATGAAVLLGIAYLANGRDPEKTAKSVALGLGTTWVGTSMGHVYSHDYASHGTLDFTEGTKRGMEIAHAVTTVGLDPEKFGWWHRRHHKFQDTPEDPHSPRYKGRLRVRYGHVVDYVRGTKDAKDDPDTDAPPMSSWHNKIYPDNPVARVAPTVLFHQVTGRSLGLTPLGSAASTLVHFATFDRVLGALTADSHWDGEPTKLDSTTNKITMHKSAERLHDEHHLKPGRANFAWRTAGSFTPEMRVVGAMEQLGWATIINPKDRPPKLPMVTKIAEARDLIKQSAGKAIGLFKSTTSPGGT